MSNDSHMDFCKDSVAIQWQLDGFRGSQMTQLYMDFKGCR